MTFMALNGLSQCTCDVQKVANGVQVGTDSLEDNKATVVVVTVGVEKCEGDLRVRNIIQTLLTCIVSA